MPVTARGLEGIVAAETRIGDVRGDEGILLYCGYDINELAGKVSYEEVIYLLWHDRLPNRFIEEFVCGIIAHPMQESLIAAWPATASAAGSGIIAHVTHLGAPPGWQLLAKCQRSQGGCVIQDNKPACLPQTCC